MTVCLIFVALQSLSGAMKYRPYKLKTELTEKNKSYDYVRP